MNATHLILATDIFGQNEYMDILARVLAPAPGAGRVTDPYEGRRRRFAGRDEAYAAYKAECGPDRYAEVVAAALAGLREEDASARPVLLGFSAGAGAVWRAACGPAAQGVLRAYCYYSVQIRHDADLAPRCPCTLVFPAREEVMDVAAMQQRLAGRPNVTCVSTPYAHGFMNHASPGFDETGYAEHLVFLTRELA
ncbi:dienelactone hydrolase [Desulfovibrio sp. X2]|uniref:dienelactone hydrolase n=1 Tax=Desulfovibrio sp. X2 TaxID=941449 RepID=UPI000358E789|nr:dienelactone hydrolase [Desulfovibrio sp. X2]EPR39847.1 dienelactone hydrolase [Desulfovibrio sp. X2]